MKNKYKKYTKFIAPVLIILCLILVLVWDIKKINAPKNNNSNTVETTATENQNSNINAPEAKPVILDSKFEIPIMMYHYIRNVDDPNDKLGINLSVTPEKFASQLDTIKADGYTTITFEDIKTGNIPEKPIILTFDDGYKDFYTNAFPELKKRNMKAVSYIITADIGKDEYMNEQDIKAISDYGIEIGSHTISHPDLAKSTEAKATKEITESKKTLEDITGKQIISFCYPSGKYNADVENIVKDAGFTHAVTTNGGITSFGDPFALNRYRLNHDTNISTYLK